MPARVLSGKEPAAALLASLKRDIRLLKPHLAIIQVGENPASNAYVRRKLEAAKSVGMQAAHIRLPAGASAAAVERKIRECNANPRLTGFILQLPLPAKIAKSTESLLRMIDPAKDIDGLTPENLGRLVRGDASGLLPATAAGVLRMLDNANIRCSGRHAVVLGRSALVGKPVALLLLSRDATVTVCHSKTAGLARIAKQADILISAIGRPGFVTAAMVKPGAVVIDVGITSTDEGLAGDVDFTAVKRIASAVSPVPGGTGPMTVASLMANCVLAAKLQRTGKKVKMIRSSAAVR